MVLAFKVSQLPTTLNSRQSADLTIVLCHRKLVKSKHRCSPLVIVMAVRLLDTLKGWTCWFIISDNLPHVVGSHFPHMVTLEDLISGADVNRKTCFKFAQNIGNNLYRTFEILSVNTALKFELKGI